MASPQTHEVLFDALDKAWLLAAAVRVASIPAERSEAETALDEAARGVVEAADLVMPQGDAARMLAHGARSQLAQLLAVTDPSTPLQWAQMDDETLLAQGRASGMNIGATLAPNGPAPAALQEGLAGRDAMFLDVGVGVGAICSALCQSWPHLRCVGLDKAVRPLALAEAVLSDAGVRDRVELRQENVLDLRDIETFDVAWLPLPLLGADVARDALRTVIRALRPGGWVLVAVNERPRERLSAALMELRLAAVDGNSAYSDDVMTWLIDAGIAEVVEVVTPSGGAPFLAGRRSG